MLVAIGMSSVRTAKDNRQYFVGELRPGLGQRSVKRTFWEQFKKDAKTNEIIVDANGVQEKYWERASPEEFAAAISEKIAIEGKKVTATVESYTLGDKVVNTFSTAIFPDEKAELVFANQLHPMVDEATGELLLKKAPKAVLFKAPEVPEGTEVTVTK